MPSQKFKYRRKRLLNFHYFVLSKQIHTIYTANSSFKKVVFSYLFCKQWYVAVRLNFINYLVGFIPCQICLYFSNQ